MLSEHCDYFLCVVSSSTCLWFSFRRLNRWIFLFGCQGKMWPFLLDLFSSVQNCLISPSAYPPLWSLYVCYCAQTWSETSQFLHWQISFHMFHIYCLSLYFQCQHWTSERQPCDIQPRAFALFFWNRSWHSKAYMFLRSGCALISCATSVHSLKARSPNISGKF